MALRRHGARIIAQGTLEGPPRRIVLESGEGLVLFSLVVAGDSGSFLMKCGISGMEGEKACSTGDLAAGSRVSVDGELFKSLFGDELFCKVIRLRHDGSSIR